MKYIRIFYLTILIFLVVKFSVYLNRHVFVMVQKFSYALSVCILIINLPPHLAV